MTVDKEGSTREYSLGTRQHIRLESAQNSEVHSEDVETVHSRELEVDKGALEAKFIEEGGIEVVDNGSRDP